MVDGGRDEPDICVAEMVYPEIVVGPVRVVSTVMT